MKHGEEVTLGCIQWQPSPPYMEATEKTEPDFTAVPDGKMSGNGHHLKQGVQTGYKEKLFPQEDHGLLEQLPRAVVQSPALEGFDIKINQALRHLVSAGGWTRDVQSESCYESLSTDRK